MPKRIISQRRGKGSPTYRVPTRHFSPRVEYNEAAGVVTDIINYPLMDAPLAKVRYPDQSVGYIIAAEGMAVGSSTAGVVLSLADIKEGSSVFGVESAPFTGPKFCRTPGSAAILVSKARETAVIQLPSKKMKTVALACRATMGTPAGEGRKERPFVKAGTRWHAMHARGKLYPRTSGNKMNAVDHPYGGSGHGKVRPPVSRHAPPGRKVGTVSPRRTGHKKGT
ncbi:MAG: 50S ribosomal protein L2 [Candidatus Aenigmarchaeota archaeon]|nr:50S ribosomal protein L2 [Candidatus Aenigmarchaeota archaeon]